MKVLASGMRRAGRSRPVLSLPQLTGSSGTGTGTCTARLVFSLSVVFSLSASIESLYPTVHIISAATTNYFAFSPFRLFTLSAVLLPLSAHLPKRLFLPERFTLASYSPACSTLHRPYLFAPLSCSPPKQASKCRNHYSAQLCITRHQPPRSTHHLHIYSNFDVWNSQLKVRPNATKAQTCPAPPRLPLPVARRPSPSPSPNQSRRAASAAPAATASAPAVSCPAPSCNRRRTDT
ncbi:uncharacterized protein J3D65DRAFT_428833 [Phyllosticta citribraziliensis]|uniref:Uncharacterized protein n=1 Tax=Phyllosticta citribraziliensis TaxID=989973 RepID=A0ABR1LI77_9PEZI